MALRHGASGETNENIMELCRELYAKMKETRERRTVYARGIDGPHVDVFSSEVPPAASRNVERCPPRAAVLGEPQPCLYRPVMFSR